MSYPEEFSTQSITGQFSELYYDRMLDTYVSRPRKGWVKVTPSVSTIVSTSTNTIYDMAGLIDSYYKLDNTGAFNATVLIPSDSDMEPNNWTYTVTFGWGGPAISYNAAELASGPIDVNDEYVPVDPTL